MSPLRRDNMTVASRIMLPSYVVVFAWLGLNYLLTAKDRLNASPTLRFVDNNIVDLRALGILLIASSALLLAALITQRRDAARYTLILAGLCCAILLTMFVIASFRSEASPSAGAWPFLGTAACLASYRSITANEVH